MPALPSLKKLVMWSGDLPDAARTRASLSTTWADFLETGKGIEAAAVAKRSAAVEPGHCASLRW